MEMALHETGLAPTMLDLELTESMIMHDVAGAAEIMHHLANLGCKRRFLVKFPHSEDIVPLSHLLIQEHPCGCSFSMNMPDIFSAKNCQNI